MKVCLTAFLLVFAASCSRESQPPADAGGTAGYVYDDSDAGSDAADASDPDAEEPDVAAPDAGTPEPDVAPIPLDPPTGEPSAWLRVVNLTSDDATIAALAEYEGIDAAPARASTGAVYVPAGMHSVEVTIGAQTILVSPIEVPEGQRRSVVIYREAGALKSQIIHNFSGQQTDDNTEVQLFHAAENTGVVDVDALRFKNNWDQSPSVSAFAQGLDFGELSAPYFPPTSNYSFGIQPADTPHATYGMGYFPDYGFTMYLTRDDSGRLLLGKHSPVDDFIWWMYADQELALVRVLNLTQQENIRVEVPSWHQQSNLPQLNPGSSTWHSKVVEGEITIRLVQNWAGTEEVATWTGTVQAEQETTLVFFEEPDGTISTRMVEDTAEGFNLRLVNLRSGAPITAQWADSWGNEAPLASDLGYGQASEIMYAKSTAEEPGEVRIDTDNDGAWDLTFQLDKDVTDRHVTTIYLREEGTLADATWPTLLVHGVQSQFDTVYAEQLLTRVRFVGLLDAQKQIHFDLGSENAELPMLQTKPAWGQDITAHYGATSYQSIKTGEYTLRVHVGAASPEVAFSALPGARKTVVVYESADAPAIQILDDGADPSPKGGNRIRVFHAASGAGPITVFGRVTMDSVDIPIASGIQYGQLSATVSVQDAYKRYTIDRNDDGIADWATAYGGEEGLITIFALGLPDETPILPVGNFSWPFLSGDEAPFPN